MTRHYRKIIDLIKAQQDDMFPDHVDTETDAQISQDWEKVVTPTGFNKFIDKWGKLSTDQYKELTTNRKGGSWWTNLHSQSGAAAIEEHDTPENNEAALEDLEAQHSGVDDLDAIIAVKRDLAMQYRKGMRGIKRNFNLSPKKISELANDGDEHIIKNPGFTKTHMYKMAKEHPHMLEHLIDSKHFDDKVIDLTLGNPENLENISGSDISKIINKQKTSISHFDEVFGDRPEVSLNLKPNIIQNLLTHASHRLPYHHIDALLKDAEPSWKKTWMDEVLGMHGEHSHSHPNDFDTKEEFDAENWDNWNTHSYNPNHNKVRDQLINGEYLDEKQIEHIKRHGDFTEKYDLYHNENIDPKHGAEMFQKWYDDEGEHGYDAEDLNIHYQDNKDDIYETNDLPDNVLDSLRDEAHEDASNRADENYPLYNHLYYNSDRIAAEIGGEGDDDEAVREKMFDRHTANDWTRDNPDSIQNYGDPTFQALNEIYNNNKTYSDGMIPLNRANQSLEASRVGSWDELGLKGDDSRLNTVHIDDIKAALDQYGGPSRINHLEDDSVEEHPEYQQRYDDAALAWRADTLGDSDSVHYHELVHSHDLHYANREDQDWQDQYNSAVENYVEENNQEHLNDLYEDAHQDTRFIPEHLHDHIPNFNELNDRHKRKRADGGESSFLNKTIKDRGYEHEYGEDQHFYEMVKDHADANNGKIDVGTMNKLYPNQKEKWKKIFKGKGKITSDEATQKVSELPKTKYDISYSKWGDSMQNINKRDQVIFRLDHSPDSLAPLKEDKDLYGTFKHVQKVSKQSGHPTNDNTIAWARVDTTDPEHWMIDEVQSDFGKTVTRYLKENGSQQKAEHIDKISAHHKNWRENIINSVLKEAKKHGAQKVSTHSAESKSKHTGSDKIHSVYKDSYKKVPRSMGFKPSDSDTLPLTEDAKSNFVKKGKEGENQEQIFQSRAANHESASDFHVNNIDYIRMVMRDKADHNMSDVHDDDFLDTIQHHKNLAYSHQGRTQDMGQSVSTFDKEDETAEWTSMGPQDRQNVKDSIINKTPLTHTYDGLINTPVPAPIEPEPDTDHGGHTYNLTPKLLKKHIEDYLEMLEKGEGKNALKGAAVALAMFQGAHSINQDSQQTANEQFSSENIPKHARTAASIGEDVSSRDEEREKLKREYSDATYKADKDWFLGKYSEGLSHHVYKQTIKSSPELGAKYGYINKLSNRTLKEVVNKNPNLRDDVHNAHYDKLHKEFEGDHELMLNAWKNGIKSTHGEASREPMSAPELGQQPNEDSTGEPTNAVNFTHRRMFKSEDQHEKGEVKINKEHGKAIAGEYDKVQHDPNNPDVQEAYGALIGETKNQFNDIMNSGIKISRMKPGMDNPYKNSKELHHDIKNNNHMWFYPTDQGFGSGDSAPKDHPMLGKTGIKHDGHDLLANDIFRIVHDINGHHKGGESGFGAKGEHQAYNTHKKMFSPLAQKALATETLGQNSWVNFGPHGDHNRAAPAETRYADQKAGLLPDHIINGNWHTNDSKLGKSEDAAKPIKDIAHEQEMIRESGRPAPDDHITEASDPINKPGKEDKKVTQALTDLKEDKKSTKTMFQRIYSMPSEDKMKGSKRAKMTGQVPSTVNVFGSHYPVVKLLNDNTLLLHTSDYGNEGKTTELVDKIKKELPIHFPDHKVIEVHHPDYRHSSKTMRLRNKKGIHSFLEKAIKDHPDPEYRKHAAEALNHLHTIKKGEFSKPIHDKRMATEGFDGKANEQNRVDRIGKYLESVGLTPDTGGGNRRDLGSHNPTSVTINAKGDPHDQQLLHEGAHAMLTPPGAGLEEYQDAIGEPGYKGKLHQTKHRTELRDAHGGGMPEQSAQQMEAGIARRAGVEPFRSPQRGVSSKSETEKSRKHAKDQLQMYDKGIYSFDPFSGKNELQGNINAYINAKEMGKKDLAEKIRQKMMAHIKAKKAMKESKGYNPEMEEMG
jgi:hypothetical protein